MKIFVNEKPLDFVLDKEENMYQVLRALSEWGAKEKLLMNELCIDGEKVLNFEAEKAKQHWEKISPRAVKEVRFILQNAKTYCIEVLLQVPEQLQVFYGLGSGRKIQAHLPQLVQRLTWLKQVFIHGQKLLLLQEETTFLLTQLKEIEIELLTKNKQWGVENKTRVEKLIAGLVNCLNDLSLRFVLTLFKQKLHRVLIAKTQGEVEVFKAEWPVLLQEAQSLLGPLEKALGEIAVGFQTFKTQAASKRLVDFIDGLEVFLLLLSQLEKVRKVSLEESIKSLNDFLKTITGAMEQADYVELSDVLEYELKEFFPELKKLLTTT